MMESLVTVEVRWERLTMVLSLVPGVGGAGVVMHPHGPRPVGDGTTRHDTVRGWWLEEVPGVEARV